MPTPPGFTAWRIVGARSCTVLPTLLPHAPVRLRRSYAARVIANLTGVSRCATRSPGSTPTPRPRAHPGRRARLEVTVGIVHLPKCAAIFSEKDRKSPGMWEAHDGHAAHQGLPQ